MHFLIGCSLLFLSLATQAQGDIYDYNFWAYDRIKKYEGQIVASGIENSLNLLETNDSPNKCLPVYKNAIEKGVFDIRYALGYFDDSQGVDILWNNKNWGLSPSLDIGVYNSIRHALTDRCEDNSVLSLCGFTENGDPNYGQVLLEKRIKLLGKSVLVKITLTQASASESFLDNKNSLKDRQDFLTAQSEDNYFNGIGVADVVIYNGHSRNGGGPDFNPPILASNLHVNYDGYYRVKKPGITRVLKQIKNSSRKDAVLTFFSCFSKKHFYNDLIKANPKQRLVLSADTIDYMDSLEASMGYLEGLLSGTCGQDLTNIAKQGDRIKNGFQDFQIQ